MKKLTLILNLLASVCAYAQSDTNAIPLVISTNHVTVRGVQSKLYSEATVQVILATNNFSVQATSLQMLGVYAEPNSTNFLVRIQLVKPPLNIPPSDTIDDLHFSVVTNDVAIPVVQSFTINPTQLNQFVANLIAAGFSADFLITDVNLKLFTLNRQSNGLFRSTLILK